MRPKHRNRRLAYIALGAVVLVAGTTLLMSALKQNSQFFYNPAEVVADGFIPESSIFRIGGLVVEGSLQKTGGLSIEFLITDFPEDLEENRVAGIIPVSYTGVVPDLFKEGKGVVVSGELLSTGEFIAEEILAKHDENYQPKKDY